MTDIPPAWTTYAQTAIDALSNAEAFATEIRLTGVSRVEHEREMGIGWALLALVEVLKPVDDVQFEIRESAGLWERQCDNADEHLEHVWATHMAGGRPPLSALRWCTGRPGVPNRVQPL